MLEIGNMFEQNSEDLFAYCGRHEFRPFWPLCLYFSKEFQKFKKEVYSGRDFILE